MQEWEANNKVHRKKIGWEAVECILLAQDTVPKRRGISWRVERLSTSQRVTWPRGDGCEASSRLFAQGTYEYGCQLLSAALALRQSCKLPIDGNRQLSENLWHSWKRLQTVGQEQMTRLRVSAVFHRSVEEVQDNYDLHCNVTEFCI
jgi:hypothetical protein